jgi:hypothetical protein
MQLHLWADALRQRAGDKTHHCAQDTIERPLIALP